MKEVRMNDLNNFNFFNRSVNQTVISFVTVPLFPFRRSDRRSRVFKSAVVQTCCVGMSYFFIKTVINNLCRAVKVHNDEGINVAQFVERGKY